MGGGNLLRAYMYDVRQSSGAGVREGDGEEGVEDCAAATAATAMVAVVAVATLAGSDDTTLAICDDVEAGTRTPGLVFVGVRPDADVRTGGVDALAAGELWPSGAVELGRESG